jgi:hypothetical protein
MDIVAILTTYNEQRFIRAILQHYLDHGVSVYLLDNESNDHTRRIAEPFLKQNLIAIETVPRRGSKDWSGMLRKKELVADRLGADWYIHADPDEFRLPPRSDTTLAEAIADVDAQGFNAINFMEYTFVPTLEAPDHDHPQFQDTMRHYYAFLPRPTNRLNAWRHPPAYRGLAWRFGQAVRNRRWRQPRVDLVSSGGHMVQFPGLCAYPVDFKMRHYILVSADHARRKYVAVDYPQGQSTGNWRGSFAEGMLRLPSQVELKRYTDDDSLDPTGPLKNHAFLLGE